MTTLRIANPSVNIYCTIERNIESETRRAFTKLHPNKRRYTSALINLFYRFLPKIKTGEYTPDIKELKQQYNRLVLRFNQDTRTIESIRRSAEFYRTNKNLISMHRSAQKAHTSSFSTMKKMWHALKLSDQLQGGDLHTRSFYIDPAQKMIARVQK